MKLGKETEILEFKKSTSEIKEAIKSIASMLNKHGDATVLFGVNNNGTIIGQQIGENTTRDISQFIALNIKPQVVPNILIEFYDNKAIIKVHVTGNDKPY